MVRGSQWYVTVAYIGVKNHMSWDTRHERTQVGPGLLLLLQTSQELSEGAVRNNIKPPVI